MDDRAVRSYIGWVGVAVGAGLLLAPRAASRLFGMEGRLALVRYLGLRDLVVGLGALTGPDLTPWIWARALSDATDGLTFAYGLASGRFQRERALPGLVAAVGFTALHIALARRVRADGANG